MLWQALAAMRDLGRLHDIASILVRYGFGDLVRRIGLANVLERAGRALHWSKAEEFAHLPPPARVRRALEEMGPTFVKLSQVLATRVDLFEPEWIEEFGKLQDSAPASPSADVLQHFTEDLGAPPQEIFAVFDPEPLAAAFIAQVHRARLEDGSEVVVKVRRPGIRPIIEADQCLRRALFGLRIEEHRFRDIEHEVHRRARRRRLLGPHTRGDARPVELHEYQRVRSRGLDQFDRDRALVGHAIDVPRHHGIRDVLGANAEDELLSDPWSELVPQMRHRQIELARRAA